MKEGYIYTDFLVDLLYNFNSISQKALSKIYLMALFIQFHSVHNPLHAGQWLNE